MAERQLQTACLKALKSVCPDAVALNVHGSGWSGKGAPDIVMCVRGRFAAAELKVGANGLSEAQRMWRKRIEGAGGAWSCPRSVEEFKGFVKEVMEG